MCTVATVPRAFDRRAVLSAKRLGSMMRVRDVWARSRGTDAERDAVRRAWPRLGRALDDLARDDLWPDR
jgi:hypothetical protein